MSLSYQLPDLLSLCRPFELRTNPFCRSATLASETWLLALKNAEHHDVLTGAERTYLHPAKFGLLAALCVPGCGQPQLLFFANLMSIMNIANGRIKARTTSNSGWSSDIENGEEGAKIFCKHELFQHLFPEMQRLVVKAKSSWETRFAQSAHSFYSAQLQAFSSHVIPDLETYLPLRRELSGLFVVLDLLELAENLVLPPMDDKTFHKFTRLKQLAIDIICCSLDVVAFNIDQVQGSRHNLITVLMSQKALSLQGAVNLAGTMIKEMFDTFAEVEASLLSPPRPPQANYSGAGGTLYSSWTWLTSPRLTTPAPSLNPGTEGGGDLAHMSDLPSYVQTLKDFIVGSINWAYESELFFGRKGEEIRTFGWVFLNLTSDSPE